MLADKLPADDWTLVSTGQSWRNVAAAGADLIAAKETVDAKAGEGGVPWTCGELRGGAGQPPVAVNADTVIAGYNVLLNRSPCETSAPPPAAADESRLVTQWATPAAAAAFAVEVLGDTTIQTCQDCERVRGTPGKGLAFVQEDTQRDIETALAALVASGRHAERGSSSSRSRPRRAFSSPGR